MESADGLLLKRDQIVEFESHVLFFFFFLCFNIIVRANFLLFFRFLSVFLFGTSMQVFLFIEINPWKRGWSDNGDNYPRESPLSK